MCGCDPGFRPETLIENLRFIGVSTDPADLRPGESARVSALLLDPSRAAPPTVLWLGCEADPFNLNRSPCANPEVLQDPAALGGGGALPPGVSLIGLNSSATYRVPAGLFDVLAPDDPRRQTGTVGLVIALAVAETVSPAATQDELEAVLARVQAREVRSVLTLFRVAISESTARNTNPVVDALVVGGEPWPAGARFLVRPGEPVTLDVTAPGASFERYVLRTPTGAEERTERVLTAWYSTSGRFSETTTALGEGVKTIFTAPGAKASDPVPEGRAGTLYTVFRDTRGGQSWRAWEYFVCDDALPPPVVTGVDWPATPDAPVVLRGVDLASVLDVVVDGAALERGVFSPSRGTFEGYLPGGAPVGAPRGVVHTRRCTRQPLP